MLKGLGVQLYNMVWMRKFWETRILYLSKLPFIYEDLRYACTLLQQEKKKKPWKYNTTYKFNKQGKRKTENKDMVVNFMLKDSKIRGKHHFCVCLWECCQKRLAGLVDLVKSITWSMWVGIIHMIWDLNKREGIKRIDLLFAWAGHLSSLPLESVLWFSGLWNRLFLAPVCRWQIMGLSFHNLMNQYRRIHLFIIQRFFCSTLADKDRPLKIISIKIVALHLVFFLTDVLFSSFSTQNINRLWGWQSWKVTSVKGGWCWAK